MSVVELPTGAAARLTGPAGGLAVVCVNGGSARPKPGTWSATLEWLVRQLSPRLPELRFAEVRYRVKSWRVLDPCMEDAVAAIEQVTAEGSPEVALVGFSMGGAVSLGVAEHPAVSTVIGLAPWIPERWDGSTLRGKRLSVIHGTLDAWLPVIPGVSHRHTLRNYERIRGWAASSSHTLVRGGVHGTALHAPWGGLVRLPRAGRWRDLVADELRRFEADSAVPTGPPRSVVEPA